MFSAACLNAAWSRRCLEYIGWKPGGNNSGWFGANGLNGGGGKKGEWGKWGKEMLASGRGTKLSRGGVKGLSGGLDCVSLDFSSNFGDEPLL